MEKSTSVSSADDDADSVCSDELLGSQSRRWLSELLPRSNSHQDEGKLFVDHNFPRAELDLDPQIEWKRPPELVSSPYFIVGGATHLDIAQGEVNDCWVLSAIASLSLNKCLFNKVVPQGQTFQDGYNGQFTFSFWLYGRWEQVTIDDRLPFKSKKLLYLNSPTKNEFWSSLLEKAYAKLKGGYTALNMGLPHEAMVDMTGGVTEVFNVPSFKGSLSTFLKGQLRRGALINMANLQGEFGQANRVGILFKHAYALTGVQQVMTTSGPVTLLRILNPWGNTEWFGPWSDSQGSEWALVSPEEQQRIGRVRKEDGEFWMSSSDFRRNFQMVEVCHMTDEILDECSCDNPWTTTMHHGTWVPGVTAGGRGASLWKNPQYQFKLTQTDRGSDSSGTCSFILALMQKHSRRRDIHLGIAVHVYKAHPTNTILQAEDIVTQRPVLQTPNYTNRREIVLTGSLPPGSYVIIPSTFEPNQHGAFLLRVLTDKGNAGTEAVKPHTHNSTTTVVYTYPHQTALPPFHLMKDLYRKHCSKNGYCKPHHLHSLLTEAFQSGVLAGTEKKLSLEHCKTFVVLKDSQADARLKWPDFLSLWEKIRQWTDIFLTLDRNKTKSLEYQEVGPALTAAGVRVDRFIMQLVGLRYTEPDITISYPGFLYLMLKLETMIHTFQAHDVTGRGTITLDYKQWLYKTLYN
ncbi:calpain-1 catalytic subunit [Neosynchiropus ocellatus]